MDTNVHFSREPRSKLCTYCRTAASGPGPARLIGRSGQAAGLAVGQPSAPGSAAASEQRQIAPMAAPRCTTVAEVMINDKYIYAFLCGKARLFRSVRGTGRLWQAWLSLCSMFSDRTPARYPTSCQCRRRPACNMVPVMRGQADTCTARLAAVLDEASTAGSSAEPYWCGRLMNDLYPDRREAVRPHGGRCCSRE